MLPRYRRDRLQPPELRQHGAELARHENRERGDGALDDRGGLASSSATSPRPRPDRLRPLLLSDPLLAIIINPTRCASRAHDAVTVFDISDQCKKIHHAAGLVMSRPRMLCPTARTMSSSVGRRPTALNRRAAATRCSRTHRFVGSSGADAVITIFS